ncbi:MAG: 16S rRNA (adenine(1518)-N(6)/adenine(1519)-N(6))-dimethyltransferase RsmA [Bacteroidia bacterium]
MKHGNDSVRAKKHLGQHFLKDESIAADIADALEYFPGRKVLEVGPGMGVLTQFLLKRNFDLTVVEIDYESVPYLKKHFPQLENRVIEGDFLKLDLSALLDNTSAVAGNFPYNISSQILFHCLSHKEVVQEITGMFQKEVAERITARHGNKSYGIITVLLQSYYTCEYLFTVHEHVFSPPPKVKSAVIRLRRIENAELPVPYEYFSNLVKTAFNQRRKTLRNALKPVIAGREFSHPFLDLRAEQLSVSDFHQLASVLYSL